MDHLKMSFLLTMRIFHCYVGLPEGRGFKRDDMEDDDFFDYDYDLYMIMWLSWWQVSFARTIVVGIPILRLGESMNIWTDTYLSTKERVYPMSEYPILQPAKCSCKFCHVQFSTLMTFAWNGIRMVEIMKHGWFFLGVLLTLRFDPAKPAKRQDKKDLWILRSYLAILYDFLSWSHFHLFGHVHLVSWKMN